MDEKNKEKLLVFKNVYIGVTAVLILSEFLITYNMYKSENYDIYKDIFIINNILLIINIVIEFMISKKEKIGRALVMIKSTIMSLGAIYYFLVYFPVFIRFYQVNKNNPDGDGLAALSFIGSFVICFIAIIIFMWNISVFIKFNKMKKLYK